MSKAECADLFGLQPEFPQTPVERDLCTSNRLGVRFSFNYLNAFLAGGAGSDAFIIRPGFGVEVITDFQAGAGTEDALLFSTSLFTSFTQVMAHSAQIGADTWIGDGLGNTVVLVGVQQNALHADDFGFI